MTQGRPHGGERLRLWLCCLPAHLNLPIVFLHTIKDTPTRMYSITQRFAMTSRNFCG
ncbi:hypothetical protein T11_4415 [Trichinella zimbabwensis]|uniref:Uncharacterized protein n=1 Tax=Trichinella zimbabwensis TaxID=268475 RepID=A0A0V1GKH3_9BILA|nr:hypothetical protein T11_4415 [Trichinella zimbabwensis]